MRALDHFLTWAKADGQEVAGKAKLLKLPERMAAILSLEQIQAIEDSENNLRDRLIVRVLS